MYFVLMGEWSPVNKLFTLGGRLFQPAKRKYVLKRAESHRCGAKRLGIFACNISTLLRFLKGIHFRRLPTESERSDQF